jgi:hypothetical protein
VLILNSIYEVVDRDTADVRPRRGSRGIGVPMPTKLAAVGCGEHRLVRGEYSSFCCTRCEFEVHPGQMLYAETEAYAREVML